ncbi:unnamed protein product [Chrysoparadoxa australica]
MLAFRCLLIQGLAIALQLTQAFEDAFMEVDGEGCWFHPLEMEEVDVELPYDCHDIDQMRLAGLGKPIGNGNWRNVHRIEHKGNVLVYKTLKKKRVRQLAESSKLRATFDARHRLEANIQKALLGHPNIVQMHGHCGDTMVTELLPVTLEDHVKGLEEDIDIRTILQLMLDMANGLKVLHEMPGGPIAHGDFMPDQVLLDSNGTAKITDFNDARAIREDAVSGNFCRFEWSDSSGNWRTPEEYSEEGGFTHMIDMYSLGHTGYFLLARDDESPFKEEPGYKERILAGERPPIDPSWHAGFVALIQELCATEATERPSAAETVLRLEEMISELGSEDAKNA